MSAMEPPVPSCPVLASFTGDCTPHTSGVVLMLLLVLALGVRFSIQKLSLLCRRSVGRTGFGCACR